MSGQNVAVTISVFTPKGGVGKTTTAVNLSACLADRGYEVLLVDVDEQSNATKHLGIEKPDVTVIDLMKQDVTVGRVTKETHLDHLYVIPATTEVATYMANLEAKRVGRERQLRKALTKIEPYLDFIIIDCPPAYNLMTVNALTASDYAIAVTDGEFFSQDGADRISDILEEIIEDSNESLTLLGILFNRFNPTVKINKRVRDEFMKRFPGFTFNHHIRKNIKIAEAPERGQAVIHAFPSSNGSEDFQNFTDEVLKRLKMSKRKTRKKAAAAR
jgi:chromosome partitioning protein